MGNGEVDCSLMKFFPFLWVLFFNQVHALAKEVEITLNPFLCHFVHKFAINLFHIIRSLKIMLRKDGRKRARVPLTREGVNSTRFMLTDEPVWMKSAARYHSNNTKAIGHFEVGLAYRHPESVLPLPCIPLGYY